MNFCIGDIAHWASPQKEWGVYDLDSKIKQEFHAKLYQQFQITDVHKESDGIYYTGCARVNGKRIYLSRLPASHLISKRTWQSMKPLREKRPSLYQVSQDFEEIEPAPAPEHTLYVLLRTTNSYGVDDYDILAVSADAAVLAEHLTKDLLMQTERGEISAERLSFFASGEHEDHRYYLSWSGEWGEDDCVNYTIEAVPVLGAPVSGDKEAKCHG